MGYEVPLTVMTVFWLLVGCGGPLIVPKGPNRPLIQLMLATSSVFCYLFWLMSSMAQVNPLFGPILHRDTIRILQREWEVSFALQIISFLAN
ncbi:V-type H+-transporting ATPase subunit e [Schistosoma bovis]|uniref:V-type proton ATPase subunit n=1 Tax=Schistosoma bovis TaxID=6184 RepID=A0A430QAT3_SCHBO|nr:V-type H+-transporting ATPase subunit e [Schistosoma bovis]